MQPLALLKCLGKALLRTAGNALGWGVGGDLLVNIGEEAWHAWQRERDEEQRRAELQAIVQMAVGEFRQQVEEVVREIAAGESDEKKQRVSAALQEVPGLLRKSLRRPADRMGQSVPPGMALQSSQDLVSLLSSSVAPAGEEADEPVATVSLTLMTDGKEGRRFSLKGRGAYIVGRKSQGEERAKKGRRISFPYKGNYRYISEHHCMLEVNLPEVFVRDLGSKGGTYLNDELIGGRPKEMEREAGRCLSFHERSVRDGDLIRLCKSGAAVFRVDIVQPTQCIDCGVVIADTVKADCEREPGVYQCGPCRKKAEELKRRAVRCCCQCERDVSAEAGSRRPGEFVCTACRGSDRIPVVRGYTIEKRLGQGGMGEVWLAERKSSGKLVAIKRMLPQVSADARSVKRALKEMTLCGRLRHRNIVRLLDVEYTDGEFVMVMECCDGGTVADLIKQRGGVLPADEAVEITFQALEGLHYAHNLFGEGKGIVHRDISPDNLFLSGQGSARVVKVGDYGLARALDDAGLSGSTRTGESAGKPHFMPRLQVDDFKNAGPEVDVWAMAASLYYMLTGSVPRDFTGIDPWLAVLDRAPVPIRERNASVPAELATLIDQALTEEPALPFSTARAFKDALEDV